MWHLESFCRDAMWYCSLMARRSLPYGVRCLSWANFNTFLKMLVVALSSQAQQLYRLRDC
ncbi:hypothetical protein D3C75_1328220 [compost metagenome]